MTRLEIENEIIFVIGTLDEMREDGLIEGGSTLGPEGIERFQALKASGFQMSQARVEAVMRVIMNDFVDSRERVR